MTKKIRRVLIIDNNPKVLEELERKFRSRGYETRTVGGLAELTNEILETRFHAATIDMRMEREDDPGDDAGNLVLAVFDALEAAHQNPLRVIFTAYPDPENQMKEAFRTGAWDYVDKNEVESFDRLVDLIDTRLNQLDQEADTERRALRLLNEKAGEWEHLRGSWIAIDPSRGEVTFHAEQHITFWCKIRTLYGQGWPLKVACVHFPKQA